MLEHCEKEYKGLVDIYAALSECAHPNFEGVCFGYSEVDRQRHETHFSNKWEAMWANRHVSLVKLVCAVFDTEYNDVWVVQMERLETWLNEHDAELEATRGKGTQ